ncbi:rhodanese-like domain-containing protein [uncultured Lutibacter sp.]|uniref:rhodanese-like domain-containing protein n=1 Tax=uncultured Lutibacter sp. TaxID=437739 RepID=UPI002617A9CD|nr:rhodanese-like domain-containing protein [uncultured Lutibacter sp.]
MKELEKTKRISIAGTLTILIVLIAVLSFERPKYLYKVNSVKTLEKLISFDYYVSLDEINNPDFILIDVRNQFEYEKGHIENAINITTSEILSDNNTDILKEIEEKGKIALLYGAIPNDVNGAFLMMTQLGFKNVKILTVENSYFENQLITKNVSIEKSNADIRAFIDESIKKANIDSEEKVVVKKITKKVITVRKKKKAPAEGGC